MNLVHVESNNVDHLVAQRHPTTCGCTNQSESWCSPAGWLAANANSSNQGLPFTATSPITNSITYLFPLAAACLYHQHIYLIFLISKVALSTLGFTTTHLRGSWSVCWSGPVFIKSTNRQHPYLSTAPSTSQPHDLSNNNIPFQLIVPHPELHPRSFCIPSSKQHCRLRCATTAR